VVNKLYVQLVKFSLHSIPTFKPRYQSEELTAGNDTRPLRERERGMNHTQLCRH